jgi:hypothetical protein
VDFYNPRAKRRSASFELIHVRRSIAYDCGFPANDPHTAFRIR